MSIHKSVDLPGDLRLLVSIADIQEEPVDSIVNAANAHLAHGGGVAAAISRAAGPALDEECFAYVRDHGAVAVGSAVLSTAGNLPFKGVIHAVGPSSEMSDIPRKLASAIAASLRIAHELGCRSVAIPGISSGIFGVSARTCAAGYMQGIEEHRQEFPDSSLREIRFTLWLGAQGGDLVYSVEAEMEALAARLAE